MLNVGELAVVPPALALLIIVAYAAALVLAKAFATRVLLPLLKLHYFKRIPEALSRHQTNSKAFV